MVMRAIWYLEMDITLAQLSLLFTALSPKGAVEPSYWWARSLPMDTTLYRNVFAVECLFLHLVSIKPRSFEDS